jgi:hypothetical protein
MIANLWNWAMIVGLTIITIAFASLGRVGLREAEEEARKLAWMFIAAAVLCHLSSITLAASTVLSNHQQGSCI